MTIAEFLEARIAEDEKVARAAVDSERPGQHWQWVTTKTDTPVAQGDLAEAQEYQTVSLRTVEEFPSSAGMLPAFPIGYAEEVDPGAGEHITRHDPSRVLAECAAKRAIVAAAQEIYDDYEGEWGDGSTVTADEWQKDNPGSRLLRPMASVYADHEDYRQEWAL